MHSALYEGWVRHRRFKPVSNAFRYSLSMAYLDLDELDSVFRKRWFWSAREFNLAWFRRDDYMIGSSRPGQPLADAVRDFVQTRGASRPLGPIRILTNLRRFGFGMNPVSFYYCFNEDGKSLHSIVAEITNSPWEEQFAYVLPVNGRHGDRETRRQGETAIKAQPFQPRVEIVDTHNPRVHRFRFEKTFHVSPFMDMAFDYDWRFSVPGERLAVHILNLKPDGVLFDSTLVLTRREISTCALASALVRFPLMTLKVFAAIYFHAAKLWIKRCPASSHPKSISLENPAP